MANLSFGLQLLLNLKCKQTLNARFLNNSNINGLSALHIPSPKHMILSFLLWKKNSKICSGGNPKIRLFFLNQRSNHSFVSPTLFPKLSEQLSHSPLPTQSRQIGNSISLYDEVSSWWFCFLSWALAEETSPVSDMIESVGGAHLLIKKAGRGRERGKKPY